MHYTKEKVMNIVRRMLGDDATGLYRNSEAFDRNNDGDFDIYSNLTNHFFLENCDDIKVRCGVTKVVLIPRGEDFVIKMPFTGIYTEKFWDTSIGDYVEDDNGICSSELEQVGISQYDHCDIEFDNYRHSSSDLKSILSKIEYVGDFNKIIPIYVQEKVKRTEAQAPYYESDFLDNETNYVIDNTGTMLYEGFVKRLLISMGLKRTMEIVEELQDSFGGDLHDENYGYTSDDLPRIFDYSDYDECTWEWN